MKEQTSSSPGVPVAWSALIAEARTELPTHVESLSGPGTRMGMLASGSARAMEFTFGAEALSMLAVVEGAAACLPHLELLDPFAVAVIRELDAGITKDDASLALAVLSYVNVDRCCGVAITEDAALAESRWLRTMASRPEWLSEDERRTAALAAAAAGMSPLVPVLIGGRDLPLPFAPHQTFGFNVQGFARYLASGFERGASAADVEPAWQSFLSAFPHSLAAGSITWPDLLWAGRAVVTHFKGRPAHEVADVIHKSVTNAA